MNLCRTPVIKICEWGPWGLPTRQDGVENRDKAYTFAINALFIYTRVLSCMRLLLSPGRAI